MFRHGIWNFGVRGSDCWNLYRVLPNFDLHPYGNLETRFFW